MTLPAKIMGPWTVVGLFFMGFYNSPKFVRFRKCTKKRTRHTHIWSVGAFWVYIKNVFYFVFFFFFRGKQSHTPKYKKKIINPTFYFAGLFFFTVPSRSTVPLGHGGGQGRKAVVI
jgi:hypothetical protein